MPADRPQNRFQTKPQDRLVIFSARGEDSFTAEQRARLEKSAEVRFVAAPRRLSPAAFVKALAGARLAGLTPRATPVLTPELLAELPELDTVVVATTGHEWLDVPLLQARGIRVGHVPDYSSDSAAEFTLGLMLSMTRHICEARRSLREGRGQKLRGIELTGRTLGVVGVGSIGSRVARLGAAFGMRVLGNDKRRLKLAGVRQAPLGQLLAESDVVCLHTPLTDETEGFIGAPELARMKPGAVLVNTARPALVDHAAVLEALDEGGLGGYGLDIGYVSRRALKAVIRHPKVLAVPHISWYTDEAVAREIEAWVEQLVRAARGQACRLVA